MCLINYSIIQEFKLHPPTAYFHLQEFSDMLNKMIPLIITFYGLFRKIKTNFKNPEFRALSLVVLSLLVIGTIFYHFVEGWGLLDSLYFSVITLATVGFGDFTPKTDLGKIFTMIYILIGVGTLVSFLTLLNQKPPKNKHKK